MLPRIRRILAQLTVAQSAQDMDLPGAQLHRLTGDMAHLWSVRVTGNWRIVFRFVDSEAVDMDLIDYHIKETVNGESTPSRRERPRVH